MEPQENDGRAALYIAVAKSFDKLSAPQPNTSESKKGENSLTEQANLFGKTVADNLSQCNPKDWTLIKKRSLICSLIRNKEIWPQEVR